MEILCCSLVGVKEEGGEVFMFSLVEGGYCIGFYRLELPSEGGGHCGMLRVVVRNEFEETEKIDRQENFGGGCTGP
jgi:hypothetical protein